MADDIEALRREIEDLHKTHKSHINYLENHHQHRRLENIQVLVALGIIGAVITILARDLFPGTAQRMLTLMMGAASSLFIFIKTTIPPLLEFTPNGEEGFVNQVSKFDERYSFIAYSVSLISALVLTFLYFVGAYVPQTWLYSNIQVIIKSIPFSDAIPAIASLILTVVLYRQHQDRVKKREALSDFNEGVSSENKRLFEDYKDWFWDNLEIKSVHPRRLTSIGSYHPDIIAETQQGTELFIEFKLSPSRREHIEALSSQVISWNRGNETRKARAVIVSTEFSNDAIEQIKGTSELSGVILPSEEQGEPELIE